MPLSRDSWYGFRRHSHDLATGLGQETDPDTGFEEPVLYIGRRGKRMCVMLKNVHFFCKYRDVIDTDFLMESARQYAAILFGEDANAWEVRGLATVLEGALTDLMAAYPPELPTKAEVEAQMIRDGLKVTVNGKTLIDAS